MFSVKTNHRLSAEIKELLKTPVDGVFINIITTT